MKFQTAVKQATEHLLKSKAARTYRAANGKQYHLDLRDMRPEHNELLVTNWRFDQPTIVVPATRPQLIRAKMYIQMRKGDGLDAIDQIALRYYLNILSGEAN